MLNTSIQKLLDDSIATGREQYEMKNWHSSGLGSCLTGTYLKRLGVVPDEDFDVRLLRVFSVGNIMEEWVLKHVKATAEKGGFKFEEQVGWKLPDLDLSGRCDARISGNGYDEVIELKTKHSKAFWYMKTRGADWHHKLQLWSYLYALNVPTGRIVYISKDDLCINEYPVFLDDARLEEHVMTELEVLNKAWAAKLPPPVMFSDDDWRAKYCSFHSQCLSQKEYLNVGAAAKNIIAAKH